MKRAVKFTKVLPKFIKISRKTPYDKHSLVPQMFEDAESYSMRMRGFGSDYGPY